MSLPKPLPGLVIRYSYLWADAAAAAVEEGAKARPAAIIMTVDAPSANLPRVYALPITHSVPSKSVDAIEIPAAVRRVAGLDDARSWVILSEFNEFTWPGFDLEIVPGRQPRSVAYGFLTPSFFEKIRNRWLALDASGKLEKVRRDG